MATQVPPEQRHDDLEVIEHPTDALELIEHRGASRLAAAGLFTAGTGAALVLVGGPEAAPFVLPPLVIAGIVGILAWRYGRWSKALAVLAGLLFILMVAPFVFTAGGMRIDSFFDLVPNTMALVGAVAAIAGGVMGLMRRETVDAPRIMQPVLAGLGVLAVISGAVTFGGSSELNASERAGTTVVVMDSEGFATESVTTAAGEATFAVTNESNFFHTFTVDELGIDVGVPPGREILVTAESAVGTYTFYCIPHSEVVDGERDGMVGTLEVTG